MRLLLALALLASSFAISIPEASAQNGRTCTTTCSGPSGQRTCTRTCY